MNKNRRMELSKVAEMIANAKGTLETLLDEEQEYMDNMPESLQGGDRYSEAEEAVSNMEDAINSLEEAETSTETSAS